MTEETTVESQTTETSEAVAPTKKNPAGLKVTPELIAVRSKADELGVKYHHRAGVKTIEKAIANHEKELQRKAKAEKAAQEVLTPRLRPGEKLAMTEKEWRQKEREEAKRNANRLVRIRLQCLNPAKKAWPGEIISVGSTKLGTFKKYIPYDTNEPYHVPKIIYDFLVERKCTVITKQRDRHGNEMARSKLIQEYAIEVLPPLTAKELKALAQRQAMAAGNDMN